MPLSLWRRIVRRDLHPGPSGLLASVRPRSRGQALVELALLTPLLMILMVSAVDLGRLFFSQITISNMAREGALAAAKDPSSFQAGLPCNTTTNLIMCRVMLEKGAPGDSSDPFNTMVDVSPGDVTVSCTPNTCADTLGDLVTVTVDGHFHLLTPILAPFTGGQDITLSESVTAQIAVEPVVGTATPSPTPTPVPTATPIPTDTPTPSPTPVPTDTPSPTPTATPCPPPSAHFTVSPSSGKKKQQLFQFTDHSTSTAGCPLTWSWNFGDGAGSSSTSTLQNPSHIYNAQGTYTVQLVASNSGGSDTDSATVQVDP
jgi:Flp pilus assembly protein TadG